MSSTPALTEAAMAYAAKGFCVLPVKYNGKKPIENDWGNQATASEEKVVDAWGRNPGANVGVLCGPKSGMIDLNVNGEHGEDTMRLIFNGELPNTPTFDARRGPHWWMRWRDGLPFKARYVIGDLEISCGNADKACQVVAPPSTSDGVLRQWRDRLSLHHCELAEIPDEAVVKLANWDGMTWEEISGGNGGGKPPVSEKLAGVPEGQRNMSATEVLGSRLGQLPDIENPDVLAIEWQWFTGWNRGNDPPMEEKELRVVWNSILQREGKKRTNHLYVLNRALTSKFGDRVEVARVEKLAGDCRQSEYHLIDVQDRRINLGRIGAVFSPRLVREAVAEQAGVVIGLPKKGWPAVANAVVKAAVVCEVGNLVDDVQEWIGQYVQECERYALDSMEAVGSTEWKRAKFPDFATHDNQGALRGPQGALYLHLSTFSAWLRINHLAGYEVRTADFKRALHQMGFEPGGRLKVTTESAGAVERRCWTHDDWFKNQTGHHGNRLCRPGEV